MPEISQPHQDRIVELVDRLRDFWRSVGAQPQPGASPEALAGFEHQLGTNLPADLRHYFLAVDGMKVDGRDDLSFRFLPLGHGQDEQEPTTLIVAEHLIGGFSYVILASGPNVYLRDDDQFWIVAGNFTEFLRLYLDSPGQLFPNDGMETINEIGPSPM